MPINYSLARKKNLINKEKDGLLYASAQHTGIVNTRKFCESVCKRFRLYDVAQVEGLIYAITHTMRNLILDGHRIELGDLGTFYPTISCSGSEDDINYAQRFIHDVKVNYTPGKSLSDLMKDAKFQRTSTRTIQNNYKRRMRQQNADTNNE